MFDDSAVSKVSQNTSVAQYVSALQRAVFKEVLLDRVLSSLHVQIHVHHLSTAAPVGGSRSDSSQSFTSFFCCSDPFKYFCTITEKTLLGRLTPITEHADL